MSQDGHTINGGWRKEWREGAKRGTKGSKTIGHRDLALRPARLHCFDASLPPLLDLGLKDKDHNL